MAGSLMAPSRFNRWFAALSRSPADMAELFDLLTAAPFWSAVLRIATPLIIGTLMDHRAWQGVWLSLALLQGVLIVTAFRVRKVRRTVLAPA